MVNLVRGGKPLLPAILLFAGVLTQLACITQASAQWRKVMSLPIEEYPTAIYFLDKEGAPQTGFFGTAQGLIWRSTDGGDHWTQTAMPAVRLLIYDFAFKDSQTGWACVYGQEGIQQEGTILKTTDGGFTWTKLSTYGYFTALHYNKTSGLLFASAWTGGGGLFSSSDLGSTWTRQTTNAQNGYAFWDDKNGISTTLSGNWTSTTDGGITWQSLPIYNECWQPYVLAGTSTALAPVELGGYLLRTDDMGATWRTSYVGGTNNWSCGMIAEDGCGNLYTQSAVTATDPAASGFSRSSDFGTTWSPIGGPLLERDTRFYITSEAIIAGERHITALDSNALWKYDLNPGTSDLKVADQELDTLGALLTLPVVYTGPRVDGNVDFVVKYDTSDFVYDETVDYNGNRIETGYSPGRARLHVPSRSLGNTNGDTVALLKMRFYPVTGNCSTVLIDSFAIAAKTVVCSIDPETRVNICAPNCSSTIARYLKSGTMPSLDITLIQSHRLRIVSSADLGEVTLEVFDQSGRLASKQSITLHSGVALEVLLPPLPVGAYYARIAGVGKTAAFVVSP